MCNAIMSLTVNGCSLALCNKGLDSFTLNEHGDDIYCKACFTKNFGAKPGFNTGSGNSGYVSQAYIMIIQSVVTQQTPFDELGLFIEVAACTILARQVSV